jgi:hypothetical protein
MKKLILILLLPISAFATDRFAALAEFESSSNDSAHGKSGEVSRYQITMSNWRLVAGNLSPSNPVTASNAAHAIMSQRVGRFIRTHGRMPNDGEFYLLWNKPARVDHPRKSEREKAQRFSNLCER